jgi:hypothetical protein
LLDSALGSSNPAWVLVKAFEAFDSYSQAFKRFKTVRNLGREISTLVIGEVK